MNEMSEKNTENKELVRLKEAYELWQDKSAWLVPKNSDLGKHKADIMRERVEEAEKVLKNDYRKQLWIAVASTICSAENCRTNDVPGNWANRVLKDFDKTFGD